MIKVIIEREVLEDLQKLYTELAKELLQKTMLADGFLSGEVLKDVYHKDRYLTIANWRSVRDWERWAQSSERRDIKFKMSNVLNNEEKVCVVENI
jgi:heme-degrading monooxygenase HmoA